MKSKLDKLKKKAYFFWKKAVHSRGRCELCGAASGKLDAHHIEGRTGSLLYDLENGILLCFTCHRRGIHNEAASVQNQFFQKITAHKGQGVMDRLSRKRGGIIKHSVTDLEDILAQYKQDTGSSETSGEQVF